MKLYFSGAFFIAFMIATPMTGFLYLRTALTGTETPSAADILGGGWAPKFEASLDKAIPLNNWSRALWGRAEYTLFGQGRKGVVTGAGGWLFTDEEFSCPRHYAQNLRDNLSAISATRAQLKAAGAKLVVVLVPEKARLFSGMTLPACRRPLYNEIRAALKQEDILVTDLLPLMKPQLFFKNDTHWTPDGARIAAEATARIVPRGKEKFSTQAGPEKAHEGDLLRYAPGVAFSPEAFISYTTESQMTGELLDDTPAPAITLVGTSYSANADWNFAGFLKQYLRSDVLNVAAEGQGPFTVMTKYLESDTRKNAPPHLVVWEMPERYFLSPAGRTAK